MGRIAQQTPGGLQYFLPDALGSARKLADPSGGIIFAQSFDPYGGLLSGQGAAATPYGFAGEWGDPSGLLYLRARYYLPQAGIGGVGEGAHPTRSDHRCALQIGGFQWNAKNA